MAGCVPRAPADPSRTTESIRNRALGAFLGLAVGDAVGTTLEFSPRDSQPRLVDMVGGGPFELTPDSVRFVVGRLVGGGVGPRARLGIGTRMALTPSVEVGIRQDGGDAETGTRVPLTGPAAGHPSTPAQAHRSGATTRRDRRRLDRHQDPIPSKPPSQWL